MFERRKCIDCGDTIYRAEDDDDPRCSVCGALYDDEQEQLAHQN